MNKQFYTYVLINSLNNTPIYVGKGFGYRAERHLQIIKNCRHYNLYLQRKVLKIWKNNGKVFVTKFYTKSEQEAFDIEVTLIEYAKKLGYELCNLTNGGEGISGYRASKKIRKKLSVLKLGIPRKPFSKETKKKMSIVHKGKRFSEEHKKHLSAAWKLRSPVSEETKRKMSISASKRCYK
jgi:hypothetical protein